MKFFNEKIVNMVWGVNSEVLLGKGISVYDIKNYFTNKYLSMNFIN